MSKLVPMDVALVGLQARLLGRGRQPLAPKKGERPHEWAARLVDQLHRKEDRREQAVRRGKPGSSV
jgi:hypothetical protein